MTGGVGTFSDKNAGTGKTVNIVGLGLGGIDAGNYTLSSTASTTADISKLALTGVTGIVVSDKVYDGKPKADIVTTGASFTGMVSGDKLSADAVAASFADKNVGTGKTVNITSLTLGGVDAGNYTLTTNLGTLKGNITAKPFATWTATSGGNWSSSANWDALPDGANVLAVSIPPGISVTYDAGNTSLQSLSTGGLTMAGGSLAIASGLSTAQYNQSGGALSLGGALSVNGSFNQSAGTIVATGPASITQTSGNLNVGSINAPAISLIASNGAITQSAGLVSAGLLSTKSSGSTTLNDATNSVKAFKALSTGVGNIDLINHGLLDVQGISTESGSIKVVSFGGVETTGLVAAKGGNASVTANSPLTIGPPGITATGDIELIATNLTSAGNITVNGNLTSTGGAVAMSAASNLAQNSTVTAALGVTVTAGASITLGPAATTFGNPVSYSTPNAPVAAPPGSATVSSGGAAPSDSVVTFLAQFEKVIVTPELVSAPSTSSTDPLAPVEVRKDKRELAVEGDLCTR